MRLAFKLAYRGEGFHGSQRQPDRRTVEGDLLQALVAGGAIQSASQARFQAASRTDRGVHALGNAVALDTPVHPRALIASVNRRLRGIWLHAYARVPAGFNPRHAVERWYRYHLRGDLPVERLRPLVARLRGSHDFRGFAKGGRGGRCRVTSARLTREDGYVALDLRADRFLWTMVRRIARALECVAEGAMEEGEFQEGLKGTPLPLEPAPAAFLWLMDVAYDVAFTPFSPGGLREALEGVASEQEMGGRLLRALVERLTHQGVTSAAATGPWKNLRGRAHP